MVAGWCALGLLWSVLAQNVAAVEVGKPVTLSGIGQPLAMLVPLQLRAGERLVPDCVNVGLQVGGEWIPKHEIQRSVEINTETGSAVIRVNTRRPVAEPIVQISVGCPSKEVAALVDPVKQGGVVVSVPPPAPVPTAASSAVAPSGKAVAATKSPVAASQGRMASPSGPRPPRWVMLPAIESDAPGMWRMDADLGRPRVGGRFEHDTRWAQSSKTAALIMATDLSAAPPAAAEAASAASAVAPLQQAAAQLQALEAQQRSLNQELKSLQQEVQEAASAGQGLRWEWLMLAGASAMLLVLVGLVWRSRRRGAAHPAA